jgi:hypothetical protein
MTPEDQKYYEMQLTMFLSEGWKHFSDQVATMKEATDRIGGVDPDVVRFKQGELSMMNWLLAWPQTVKDAYEARLAEEIEEDAQTKEAA